MATRTSAQNCSHSALYVINSPNALITRIVEYGHAYTKRSTGRSALRAAVRASASECRRSHGRAGVIKHSADAYEIRIGNRQGFHLWERLVLGKPHPGARIIQVIRT